MTAVPLTPKGRKILRNLQREYGPARGKAVFYASINKGLIKGAEGAPAPHSRRSAAKS